MADHHARTRYTKRQVEAIIRGGINACNGRGPDLHGFARVMRGAIAYSLFSSIHQAFLEKSAHGRDELGFQWIDLKAQTKAYQRMDARKGLSLPGPKYRPTLSASQDRVWRGIFARVMRRLSKRGFTSRRERSRMSARTYKQTVKERCNNAAAISAGAAWEFVKEQMGAVTLIGELAAAKIPLLQDTHRLIESLEPAPLNSDGSYSPINTDQVYTTGRGSGLTASVPSPNLTIGTRVPYAEYVHKLRPLWPANLSVWVSRAVAAGSDAVTKHLAEVLRRGP